MGAESLSLRSIMGMFYRQLEEEREQSWEPQIAFRVNSDQAIEEFPFLSAVPVMREWIGGRQAKGFYEKSIRIPNKHWEATIDFKLEELRRDKTGQVRTRIGELAARAAAHPRSLLSALLLSGDSSLCYDGQFFFDTDHAEGVSGAQSNSITVDITTLNVPLARQGTTTAPSGWVLAEAIARSIMHFKTLKDDVGEPIHQESKRFLVMVPVTLLGASQDARREKFSFDVANILASLGYDVSIQINPRLTWTDKFVVFRTDADMKALIHQVETDVGLKAKGEGSDFTFDTNHVQYGIDQWSNVEYGFWQYAILSRLV